MIYCLHSSGTNLSYQMSSNDLWALFRMIISVLMTIIQDYWGRLSIMWKTMHTQPNSIIMLLLIQNISKSSLLICLLIGNGTENAGTAIDLYLARLMDQKLIHIIRISALTFMSSTGTFDLIFFITLCDFLEFWIAKGFAGILYWYWRFLFMNSLLKFCVQLFIR